MVKRINGRVVPIPPTGFEGELEEAERVAALPHDQLEAYVDKVLTQQWEADRRTHRKRVLLTVIALAVAWGMGAACAAHTLAKAATL